MLSLARLRHELQQSKCTLVLLHLLHQLHPDPSGKSMTNRNGNAGQNLGNGNLSLAGLRLPPEAAVSSPDLLAGLHASHLDVVVSSWLLPSLVLPYVDDADRERVTKSPDVSDDLKH